MHHRNVYVATACAIMLMACGSNSSNNTKINKAVAQKYDGNRICLSVSDSFAMVPRKHEAFMSREEFIKESDRSFKKADTKRDKLLSFDEFYVSIRNPGCMDIQAVFNHIDANADGFLSIDEMNYYQDSLFIVMDKDKNRYVTLDEYAFVYGDWRTRYQMVANMREAYVPDLQDAVVKRNRTISTPPGYEAYPSGSSAPSTQRAKTPVRARKRVTPVRKDVPRLIPGFANARK